MSQRRHQENSNNDSESNRQSPTDGLEFVPTLLKMKQLILLRHSDFLRLLEEFNNTLENFTHDEPHYLRFSIIPHTDSNLFWKALIRIQCSKVNIQNETNLFIFL